MLISQARELCECNLSNTEEWQEKKKLLANIESLEIKEIYEPYLKI